MKNIKVVISDAHKSIRKAVAEIYPEAAWQRCQVHLHRNIIELTAPKYKEGLNVELIRMFQAKDREESRRMCLPDYIRVVLRTTNVLERLNRELKRRSDVIQVFPNKESVLRLMRAVTIEYKDIQSSIQR